MTRGPGQAVPSSLRGAALVGLAVIVGIIGLQILDDSGGGSSQASTPSGPTTTTTGTQPALHDASEITVKVFNASDVQGAAQQISDKLKSLRYVTEDVATLNTTRKGTVVACRSGFEADADLLALFGVANGATTQQFPSSPPDGSESADCIVILGKQ